MWSVFTAEKSFKDPWIGAPRLNQYGLHVARVLSAASVFAVRTRLVGPSRIRRALRERGIYVRPSFLPEAQFQALRAELMLALSGLPTPPPEDPWYGPNHPFESGAHRGHDRYDGATLNRFLHIDHSLPLTREVGLRLAEIGARCAGTQPRLEKVMVQENLHGNDRANHDPQKDLHRDTFHSAIKLWLFIDPVEVDRGAFQYVPTSHRLTPARLRWEHARALAAPTAHSEQRGGSFRVYPDDLVAMGLPAPLSIGVPKNTLVVANVAGFHARGAAPEGTRRVALHGSFRPQPFVPFPY